MEAPDITLGNIKREWHWVRPGLEAILHGSPDINELPEDIYAACITGNAHLWCHVEGFVVTRFVEQEDGEKGLLLWHAWAKQMGDSHSLQFHEFFERMALDNGCEYMETQTIHQPLVHHFIDRLGYRVKTQILVKDIG